MTATASRPQTITAPSLEEVLEHVRDHAAALDREEEQARHVLPLLAEAGALGLGVPHNDDGGLPAMAQVVSAVAAECVSSAFTLWAHRMTLEYLAAAATPYALRVAADLRDGTRPGVTGMASAFRELAGCGSLDLAATGDDQQGYVVSGTLRWASNLYPDAQVVTAARTERGERIVITLPIDTPGVSVGSPFPLLGLGSTASSSVTFEEVRVAPEQVLAHELETLLVPVRGTFLTLQTALCVGLAGTAIDAARTRLTGINSVFVGEVDQALAKLDLTRIALRDLTRRVGAPDSPTRAELLSLRLSAAEVATAATTLEVKTAGGAGYASRSATSRRFRESFFIPVQSPSEAQLRWELAQCER